jgi:WD40 repeat protein
MTTVRRRDGLLEILGAHPTPARHLAALPGGDAFVSIGHGGTLRRWNALDGGGDLGTAYDLGVGEVATLAVGSRPGIGPWIAAAGFDGIGFWPPESNDDVPSAGRFRRLWTTALAATADQPTVLWVGTAGGSLVQYEIGGQRPLRAWRVADVRIRALAAMNVGGRGVVAAAVGSDVHVFATGWPAAITRVPGVTGTNIAAMAGVTAGGRGLLVVVAVDGTVRTVDPLAGTVVGANPWPVPARVRCLSAIDRDGGGVVVTGDEAGGVTLHDPATGTAIRRSVLPGGRVHALATTTGPDAVRVWASTANGDLLGLDAVALAAVTEPIPAHSRLMLPVVIGDDLVITNGIDGIRGWDRRTGLQRVAYTAYVRVWSMVTVALPDGRLILAVAPGMDSGDPVRRWDARTGEPLPPLADSAVEVMAMIVVTGDGRSPWIAGGLRDGTIRRWDADTGEIAGDDIHAPSSGWMPAGLATYVRDGSVVLVWAREAATVRQWNARTGEPTGAAIDVALDIDDMIVVADRDEPFVAVVGQGDRDDEDPDTAVVYLVCRDARTGRSVGAAPLVVPTEDHAYFGGVRTLGGVTLVGTVGDDFVLREWDPFTGVQVREQRGVLGRAVSPRPGGGYVIATITSRHTITIEHVPSA